MCILDQMFKDTLNWEKRKCLKKVFLSLYDSCPPGLRGKNCNGSSNICDEVHICYPGSTCIETPGGNITCLCQPGNFKTASVPGKPFLSIHPSIYLGLSRHERKMKLSDFVRKPIWPLTYSITSTSSWPCTRPAN